MKRLDNADGTSTTGGGFKENAGSVAAPSSPAEDVTNRMGSPPVGTGYPLEVKTKLQDERARALYQALLTQNSLDNQNTVFLSLFECLNELPLGNNSKEVYGHFSEMFELLKKEGPFGPVEMRQPAFSNTVDQYISMCL